ncbi:MAG: CHAT domain-containing protein [Bacteroidia bacterium]|nr:CHAT domain-containing protein [Bacteroidia bacterium]
MKKLIGKGNIGILILCFFVFACNTPEKQIVEVQKSSLMLADSFYRSFYLDSALFYNEKALREIPSADTALTISRLNLHIRLAKLKRNDSLCFLLSDSVHRQLEKRNDTTSLLYITWLNGMGGNYLTTNPDTARFFLSKALRINEKTGNDPEQRMRSCRSLAYVALFAKKYSEALPLFNKNIQIAKEWKTIPPFFLAQAYNDLGYFYVTQTDEKLIYEAEKNYEKAYNILAQHLPEHPQIVETGYTLGYHQFRLGKYVSALPVLRKVLALCQKTGNMARQIDTYKLMGNILREQGETDLAMEQLKTASYLCEQKQILNPYVYNDLGLIYRDKKQYPEAIAILRKSISLYYPDQAFDIASALYNIGCFHFDNQQYDSAVIYLQKIPNLPGHKDNQWLTFQQKYMLGLSYIQKENLSGAEKELSAAASIADSAGLAKSWQMAEIYGGFTTLARKKGDLQGALAFNQQAIQSLSYLFEEKDIRKNPGLKGMVSPKYLLSALVQKSDLLRKTYQQNKNEENLKLCLSTSELAQDLIDTLRLAYQTSGSKLSLMNESFSVYEKSIQYAWELYQLTQDKSYLEKAFLYTERNKATLLYESLQSLKASTLAGIPDSVLNHLQALQTEIGYLENQKYARNDIRTDSLQKVITEVREEYQKLNQQIEQVYPDFSRLKAQTTLPDLKQIRSKLKTGKQGLAEFFMGDSTGYVFYLYENGIEMRPFTLDSALIRNITELRKQLTEREFIDAPEKCWQLFTQSAGDLYNTLLRPVLPSPPERLLIIPDGLLGYIPFEILLTDSPKAGLLQYAQLDYLIKKTRVSYAYSGMIWSNPLPVSQEKVNSCIAFAPVFEEKKSQNGKSAAGGLATLTYTREEVESVAQTTNGKAYLEDNATETRFKQEAAQYRIIHLATHALINDESVLDLKLAFAPEEGKNDGFLYVYELFGMRLNAQMAVLSACNTGYGKLQRGEGVMSLARGFAQAGVPSVVMSLWPAQDKSTGRIMDAFYGALAGGKSKDDALSESKLSYLSETDKLSAHPYFWAAFVVMGDTTPLQFPVSFLARIVIVSLLAGGLAGAIWFFRRRKKAVSK